jgi:predicted kinase
VGSLSLWTKAPLFDEESYYVTVIYVSGAPGSGKSTLAVPLAARLAVPLLSKDVIKERLFEQLPVGDDDPFRWSRSLGQVAMSLMWELAAYAPIVMLEANFRPRSRDERAHLGRLGGRLVEVHCACPPRTAMQRYASRATDGSRHLGAHPLTTLTEDFMAEFDGPVGLGGLVTVATDQPVNIEEVASQVRALVNYSCGPQQN